MNLAKMVLVFQGVVVVPLVVTRLCDVNNRILWFVAVCSSSSVALSDLSAAILQTSRSWSLFIIILDILLFCRADSKISEAIIVFVCLYLSVCGAEYAFRFGLFDLGGIGYSQEVRRELQTCDNLPCPVPILDMFWITCIQLFAFLVDFMATRAFARGMAEEQERMMASIRTANEVATCLAKFDLKRAGQLLEEADIPLELQTAFGNILRNLHTYQPYLPQSCLPRNDDISSEEEDFSVIRRRSSCDTSDTAESKTVVSTAQSDQTNLRKGFHTTTASLIVININNSKSVLDHSLKLFEGLITALVGTTFDIIMKCKGTPDLFLGDRMFANFGASLQRSQHVHACLDCGNEILKAADSLLDPFREVSKQPLSLNVGACTGQIACGDLGNENMLRFSLIGNPSRWVAVVERIGSFLGIPFLICESFHKQICSTSESRVVLQPVECGDGVVQLVFEVMLQTSSIEVTEWMYQMEMAGVGKWDSFNKVAVAVLRGQSSDPVSVKNIINGEEEYCERLRKVIDNGVSPLVVSEWERF
eukprot:TRINITY_DN1145_c0_g1_i4.p1 TRINITY_DN1145_c0_g1~~TRINITY_DN1145_c0_g1_i4.p1  ORF type:complete len:533 (+),score=98.68 TRINITY_DN1145_c0_g1_i4:204-1802(+)